MTLSIIIIIHSLFLPFITTFKSLILGDLPGFSYTSISSCTHASAILDTSLGKSTFFFHLLLKLQIKNLTLPSCSASKTTFRKALFTNKCANFIKNYENKLHLLRQNGITTCFFSNLNCFLLIIDTLNQETNTTIIFQHKKLPLEQLVLTKIMPF